MTIGAIAVDWSKNVVWVGTGEVNSSRSSYAGNGMYKSTDGGKTWSADFFRSLGAMGETRARAIYTRHGRSRNRVYQLVYSDPTVFAFYGAWINEAPAIAA